MMRRFGWSSALLGAAVSATWSIGFTPALADTPQLAPVTATAPYVSFPGGFAETVTSPQGPYVEVSGNAAYPDSGGTAYVDYQFSLDGPSNEMVEIAIEYYLYTATTTQATGPQASNPDNNDATAAAALDVFNPYTLSNYVTINNQVVYENYYSGVYFNTCSYVNAPCYTPGPSSIAGVIDTSFPSNSPIQVDISAFVGTYGGNNTGLAIADPEITVLTPGFTLNLPPGIANTDVVGALPEPSDWMLMIGGIGVIGAVFRTRRASNRLAAA